LEGVSIAQRVSGSGSQLEGAWSFSEFKYRVVSGTMTAEEKAEHDEDMATWKEFQTYDTLTMEFSGETITYYSVANTAGKFMARWNGSIEGYDDSDSDSDSDSVPDSAKYSVVLNTIDRHTVELRGALTGETVRIKITPKGEVTYTSDKAEHDQHVFLTEAPTCPNDFQPEWYSAFLRDNAKFTIVEGAGKLGASDRDEKARNSRRIWGVLPLPFR
jgi:hypothetical protein